MKGRYAFALAALVAGIGIGWLASRTTAGSSSAPASALGPALTEALAEGSPTLRSQRLAEAVAHLDAGNVAALVDFIEREREFLTEWEVRLLVEAWTRLDPAAAAGHLFSGWAADKRAAAMEALVQRWGLDDPLAAARFVDQRLEGAPRHSRHLVRPFVVGWAYSGVPGVFDYVMELEVHLRPTATVAMVDSRALRLGVDGLLLWAEGRVGQGDKGLRRHFFRHVTTAAARRDPAAAADWVMAHVDREYAIDGTWVVAEHWLPRAPDAAFAWLSAVAPEEFRVEAAERAAGRWPARDLEQAGAWLESQSLVPLHDPILAVYAGRLAHRDGEAAIAWAERIHDEPRRIATLQEVAGRWYAREPEAAEAWLQTSPLPEDTRQAIRSADSRVRARRSPRGKRD